MALTSFKPFKSCPGATGEGGTKFKRLVSETMASYRHEAKTHRPDHLGESFYLGFTLIKKELRGPRRKSSILEPRHMKLQTTRFRNVGKLQTRDLVENDRLDVLYLLRAKSLGLRRN